MREIFIYILLVSSYIFLTSPFKSKPFAKINRQFFLRDVFSPVPEEHTHIIPHRSRLFRKLRNTFQFSENEFNYSANYSIYVFSGKIQLVKCHEK